MKPPIPACPDCNQPATDGHADVCEMAWVVQDRVPVRTEIDEFRWSDWPAGKWIIGMPETDGWSHGKRSCQATLQVRCRRRDLPPVAPAIPDESPLQRMVRKHVDCMGCTTCGEFCEKDQRPDPLNWPHSTVPKRKTVRLWISGIDGSVFHDYGPQSIDDREIKINLTTGEFYVEE